MGRPGPPNPLEAEYRPSSPLDHEPHGIGRYSAAVLFLGIWAACAMISFWRTTPPDNAGLMFAIGCALSAIAGFRVARIRSVRPRRRCAWRSASCAPMLPFVLGRRCAESARARLGPRTKKLDRLVLGDRTALDPKLHQVGERLADAGPARSSSSMTCARRAAAGCASRFSSSRERARSAPPGRPAAPRSALAGSLRGGARRRV